MPARPPHFHFGDNFEDRKARAANFCGDTRPVGLEGIRTSNADVSRHRNGDGLDDGAGQIARVEARREQGYLFHQLGKRKARRRELSRDGKRTCIVWLLESRRSDLAKLNKEIWKVIDFDQPDGSEVNDADSFEYDMCSAKARLELRISELERMPFPEYL